MKHGTKIAYAKVGTVPMLVTVDRRFAKRVGNSIRFRCPAIDWERGVIEKIAHNGQLFIARV